KTTATASKTDSPRTGVAGVGIPFAAVITAAGLAYAIRRKRDDE
ncbi:MAG: NPXTG-anchored protein, partial [Ruminococcus sp.]|nr:NPXTG-anchored protein [Ruminococcus sp.]